ncbi:diphthamide biosynthesis protein 2 [Saprolegnia diclina VS20]|uniref:2-(3-amino-3-carboxypropyl)histidine synthase subunit 2 n=1 Tax=Saprolegnia diclina (strain VS20) TaxID=1156394 RepID=T0QM35_SAPDV|nr:diphthamide biosynthesis protein 2 [Saprolegnia diclina VS20]EQC34865.1 diphthamide biosynthesis protein 2 [Saprolegnia diclina VS20]|eukprot:XP_008611737.1 diphthamide biosynthesis protein 2 [Saprolegnia diclina VS20]
MASTGFAVDDGSRAMQQTIEIHYDDVVLSSADVAAFYDVRATAATIAANGYRAIALQFPDALLPDAQKVQSLLKDALRGHELNRLFVLGDTSYGSCCVDEVAAQHLKADVVVHYGRACLSPTSTLPVIYVFGNAPCEINQVCDGLEATLRNLEAPTRVVVMYEPCYAYLAASITSALAARHTATSFVCSVMRTMYIPGAPTTDNEATTTTIGGMTVPMAATELFSASTTLLYIGKETSHLTNILLRCGETPCFSFNPTTQEARREGGGINRTLNRRYFLVQRAKEAQIIGILMGTLGVAKYLDVVHTMQDLIAKSGRKSYTFVVGKINVPKLSNFAEIDLFVLVACPENSLFDSTDYFKPIITPYELQLALDDDAEWTAQYKSDFEEVLPALEATAATIEDAPVSDEPYFSLVTGTYMSSRHGAASDDDEHEDDENDATTTALATKDGKSQQLSVYKSEAAEFLQTREYRGLEPRLGETAPHAAVQGALGIARGYDHEH